MREQSITANRPGNDANYSKYATIKTHFYQLKQFSIPITWAEVYWCPTSLAKIQKCDSQLVSILSVKGY